MPLYIVSWSDGECMLMRCRNEDDLIDRLDRFDDPTHATWEVYRGPLAISLRPEVDRSDEMPTVVYSADLTGCDTFQLHEAVTRFAFPRTYAAECEARERGEDVGLELLLQAEIESKGPGEETAERVDVWLVNRFINQLSLLPEAERERRLDMLCRVMGITRPQ